MSVQRRCATIISANCWGWQTACRLVIIVRASGGVVGVCSQEVQSPTYGNGWYVSHQAETCMQSQCKTGEVSPNAHTNHHLYIGGKVETPTTNGVKLVLFLPRRKDIDKILYGQSRSSPCVPPGGTASARTDLPVRNANKGLPEFSSNHGRCVVPVHGSPSFLKSRRMNAAPSPPSHNLLTISFVMSTSTTHQNRTQVYSSASSETSSAPSRMSCTFNFDWNFVPAR